MIEQSLFYIPCPCGLTVASAARVVTCECGRILDVSAWGQMPTEVQG